MVDVKLPVKGVLAAVLEHVHLLVLLDVVLLVVVLVKGAAKAHVLEVVIVVVEDAQVAVVVHVKMVVSILRRKRMDKIKEQTNIWQSGSAKTITFIVTKDCQLACKYCYLVGKNVRERMHWDTAKTFIDYVMSQEAKFREESVVWDFIGGEPFLEIELIDKICDYIKLQMFEMNHHWFNSYRFSFSTNGLNYHTQEVQNFIKKNYDHLSIGITIDGTKNKHDMNRVYKFTEQGSYQDVVRNIPLWLSQFPDNGTKVTISSADISYIAESVLHLYELGIHQVNINVVFEKVWKEGDDVRFEEQLTTLADFIIDNGWYKDYTCSFFSEHIGKPLDAKRNNNWCGAGRMLAVDAVGNFYPCTRFAQYSLRDKEAWIIGNIHDGIDNNKLRPFLTLDRCTQSSPECIDCEVAEGCAWCQGENFDAAQTHTVFQRATAICKMHKARVRANNYYWNKLYRKLELEGLREEYEANKKTINPETC